MSKQDYRGGFGRKYHPYPVNTPSTLWGNIGHAVIFLLVLAVAYMAVNP
ncbi:MAG: hypothetical protein VXW65_12310 [Pseudomonadota bacterium]|nr:hypothetical protein [Pseudomonadota bacterium]